jgi:hypothetical protein
MAENPTFDFGQSLNEQPVDERLSPLESAQAPAISGGPGDDFMKNFSALNANTKVDVFGSGRPMSISQRLTAPVGPSSMSYAPESLTDQYMYQEGFESRYFNPYDPTNYQKFADKETWGSALGKGFDSFGYKFGNTFTDYWKGYGRMAEALFTMDWDKLRPDETTMMEQYYQDQIDMKKNFVFEQPENEDSIFSKRTMSEFVGNAGFALGTFAGLGLEIAADVAITALTGGAGAETFAITAANQAARTAARAASKTSMMGKVANFGSDVAQGFAKFGTKSVDELRVLNKMDEAATIANATPSALRSAISENLNVFTNNLLNISKSKSFAQAAENILKGTPLLGTGIRYGERVAAAAKGGATAGQLTGLTLQGVRRVAQELNMSATEASFEAVTSYGDTLDKMVQQYKVDNDGQVPTAKEFENMRSLAMNASASNYNTNMAILLATNKLQFGTLFNKFLPASMIVGESAEQILKVEAKGLTQLYKKGFTGAYGLTAQVARDFGKKEAAYQFGKAFFKDALKFEVVEGLQENLQETTASGWRDYYAGQMNGTKYTLSQAFGKGAEEQFTKQGLKTFLMGALTGSIIRLPTAVATRTLDKANAAAMSRQYKGDEANNPVKKAEKQLDDDIKTLNTLFRQAKEGKFEQKVFNFNAQMNASQEQTEAAARGNKYEFENAKDNALLSAVATAKRTHSIDALYGVIKNMGNEMTAEEFEKSFGVSLDSTKYTSPKEFSEEVARDLKKYSDTIDNVREFAKKKLADPNRFAKGSQSQLVAGMTRQVQEDAIQLIALNAIKGEMSSKRAKEVASDILAMPQMGPSADYALRILTGFDNSFAEIGTIGAELKILRQNLAAEGLDPDIKKELQEQIKSKEEELQLINQWATYWNTRKNIAGKTQDEDNFTDDETQVFTGKKVVEKVTEKDDQGNDVEVEQDLFSLDHPEVIETFKKLMNLKNKQAGNKTELSEQVLRESFEKIYDYMRLDTDTRDYMRSVDSLMNPQNFQVALARMLDGKFKFSVVTYTENLIRQTTSIAAMYGIEVGLSLDQATEFTKKVTENLTNSESYKNLLALAVDPNLGIVNQEYAIQLQKEIQDITMAGLRDAIAEYKNEGLQDITTQELEDILAEGSLEYLSIRRINIIDKLVKGQPLLANELKVYENFKEEFDLQVAQEKQRKSPETVSEESVEEQPVEGFVGPDGELIQEVPTATAAEEEVVDENTPVIVVDEDGTETIQEPVVTQEPARQEIQTDSQSLESVDPSKILETEQETLAKIQRKDLFVGVGEFATQLGGSNAPSVPVMHKVNNGIELVAYANPTSGLVDVVVSGTSENDFVGFYRLYENGLPTDKWSSKFESQSGNKEGFKTMLSGVQAVLPENHQYTEKTSISTDGLRVWNQQLSKGYQLQYDADGNIITDKVAINGDAIVNVLGVEVSKGNFANIRVSREEFETVKAALLPFIQPFGLDESNIRLRGADAPLPPGATMRYAVEIDLPVLRKSNGKPAAPAASQELTTLETEPTLPDQSDFLAGLPGMAGVTREQDEAFEVDATEDGTINVVDKNNNIVNPEPFTNEAEAQEQADSLNVSRANLDFAQSFIGPMLEDPADTSKVVEMVERGKKSMTRYNGRNNTEFTTLEEYHKTPKGKELLEGIRESVLTGKPVKYTKSKGVVTTLQVEEQLTLFSTTTTPSTSASLTLESLQILNSKVEEFKAQLKDNSEKSSKFVNEGTVSESSIIEELQRITSCFS